MTKNSIFDRHLDPGCSSERFDYWTKGGIEVARTIALVDYRDAIEPLIEALDERRGALFSSG